jgi:predicted acyl esterase
MVPWEGFSDSYRDSARHGGIKSSSFFPAWWDRQIAPNQYGKPGRAASNWGDDTVEGTLSEVGLKENQGTTRPQDSVEEFADDPTFTANKVDIENIQVPFLSVGNWGGNALHLRGNVEAFTWAGSKLKYLRLITGRHDLPFYEHDSVEIQRSFLDAFLKGDDREGWMNPGEAPPVTLAIRKGDVGFNNPEGDAKFEYRAEPLWPIERTQYAKYYLCPDGTLGMTPPSTGDTISWKAPASLTGQSLVQFTSAPFEFETEITGHIVAHLNISLTADIPSGQNDFDVFVTLRHISNKGAEIFYTGTVGDPTPIVKGWLRASLRRIDESHRKHRSYLPRRNYLRSDVQPVVPGEIYPLDVELWPTSVVIEAGSKLVVEISSGDTQGVGIFEHNDETDRYVFSA